MIVKILCLVLVLAITWVWLNRGFFNAFIHMLCTIAAGAIAFAAFKWGRKTAVMKNLFGYVTRSCYTCVVTHTYLHTLF